VRTIKFCSIAFGVTSRFSVINKIHSSSFLRDQQTPPLSATSDEYKQLATVKRHSVYNTWRSHRWQHAMKLDIDRKQRYFSYSTCTRRPSYGGSKSKYCHEIWCGKTKLAWLPDGEKNDDMTTRFDAVSERDEQTDGHRTTAWEAFMHSIARQQKLESLK